MEDRGQKVYNFIKGNLMNIVVIITSFAYLFFGQIGIEPTSLSILTVITGAGFGIIIGFIIKQSLGENGITKGYSSTIWKDNMDKYSQACNLAIPYLDKIDNFYLYEEIRLKKEFRRKKLMQYRMNYDWFFDNLGNYVENSVLYNKLDKKQKKVLKKCINVKIYTLNLMSEYDSDNENLTKKESTDKNQRLKMLKKNTFAQLFSAIAGVYFVPMLKGWNWASFIVSTIQVSIWIATGVTQLYANYNYIVIDKVNKLSKKKEGIMRFIKGCEDGIYNHSPYEECKTENKAENKLILSENNRVDNYIDNNDNSEFKGVNNE